jgi:hypothetical protein
MIDFVESGLFSRSPDYEIQEFSPMVDDRVGDPADLWRAVAIFLRISLGV